MSGSGLRVRVTRWPCVAADLSLAQHDVAVVSASLLASDDGVRDSLGVLSADERARFESYTNVVVARRFAVGRRVVRDVLGTALGMEASDVPLCAGVHGKPALRRGAAPKPMWFSVAHCEDLILVALSRTSDVGIDLERSRAIEHWERVAERVLDPVERAQLLTAVERGDEAGPAFLRHWCRVEAELKAIGCGIDGLDAHRAGKRPLGLRVVDLDELPLPPDLSRAGARYQAAVAVCCLGVESARQIAIAPHHEIRPTITPTRPSTA
ncbi:MAG TPA: 4'-phosphopantetheinyl transferase superfamily protein [Gemmatimonadaceae bacterium]